MHMIFKELEEYGLQVATTGASSARIIVIRDPGGGDVWDQVEGSRVLVVGGAVAVRKLRELLANVSRRQLQDLIPGGVSSSVHTSLRKFVGLI